MPTIEDVAKEAKVSVATVSRTINNNGSLSDKSRISVENAIKKLNYVPNMLARNLRRSESRVILALLPNISNPFYASIIQGIEDTAIKDGYNIILCQTHSSLEREKSYFNLLKQKLADGIINMDPIIDNSFLLDISEKYPIVQCCEYSDELNIPYVAIDNKGAAYRAIEHLISIGRKSIAFINTDERFMYARQRKEGYLQALSDNRIEFRSEWVVNTNDDFECAQRTFKYFLSLNKKPNAIFAVSDILAIGVIKAAAEASISVPEDIAVIGFDNIPDSKMCTPAVTTISQPMYNIGCEACKMLIRKLMQDENIPNKVLEVELIIRGSTLK
ncbi:MAG TPA: LacI family DNA-binding transcriptional regulator [Clostridiaceae bacterium]